MAGIAALAVAYVLSQFYRSFMAVLTPVLTTELGMSKVDLSVASGAWFAMFALAQLAVGIWLDRSVPGGRPRRARRLRWQRRVAVSAASAPWMVAAAMALTSLRALR